MKKLNLYQTEQVDELAWPKDFDTIHMDSPALDFFTDFEKVKPFVIDSSVSAPEAHDLMRKTHVRLKFVINEHNHFIGIVASEDLIERKIVKKVTKDTPRNELDLRDFMTPKKDLKALDFKEIADATISDVVKALQGSGQQHCLVVDHDIHKIRGIFSASDISRKLHLPINIQEESTFLKVFSAIAGAKPEVNPID